MNPEVLIMESCRRCAFKRKVKNYDPVFNCWYDTCIFKCELLDKKLNAEFVPLEYCPMQDLNHRAQIVMDYELARSGVNAFSNFKC